MAGSPEAIVCVTDAAATDSLLGLRLGGLFGILAVSSIGVFSPLFAQAKSLESTVWFLRCVAAGVVLATGFVHVLGDAYPILTDPCLGLSGEYPWAMTFATFAALFTFCLEYALGAYFEKRAARIEAQMINEQKVVDGDPEKALDEMAALKRRLYFTTVSLTFEAGIIFHSIFIGITLGITANPDTARALMIALMFHQACEGLALGSLFLRAEYTLRKYILLGVIFLLITPIGVAIGIGVGASYQSESKVALAFEGGFDSLSAGILIYNAIADLILPTFAPGEMPENKWMKALGFFGLFLGAGIMSLIGKWA